MLYAIIGIVILVAVIAVVVLKLSTAQAQATAGGIVSRPIMTENELEFFHRLQRALPEFYVFPQMAANALLQVVQGLDSRKRVGLRNQFAQKHVDYVLCERETLRVVALIELDDRTHRTEKDEARDLLFGQAGYITHRFESRRKPSDAEIAALFALPAEPEPAQF